MPFYSAAGTEFMEVFVGVGASRVRDMFQKARKAAPCILFIDEFDGIGQQRSSSAMGNDGAPHSCLPSTLPYVHLVFHILASRLDLTEAPLHTYPEHAHCMMCCLMEGVALIRKIGDKG